MLEAYKWLDKFGADAQDDTIAGDTHAAAASAHDDSGRGNVQAEAAFAAANQEPTDAAAAQAALADASTEPATAAVAQDNTIGQNVYTESELADANQQPADAAAAQDETTTGNIDSAVMQQRQTEWETEWRCSSCNKVEENMRQCGECRQWDCRSCSFWCTRCPKGENQFNICGSCNRRKTYLIRVGKIWCCSACHYQL